MINLNHNRRGESRKLLRSPFRLYHSHIPLGHTLQRSFCCGAPYQHSLSAEPKSMKNVALLFQSRLHLGRPCRRLIRMNAFRTRPTRGQRTFVDSRAAQVCCPCLVASMGFPIAAPVPSATHVVECFCLTLFVSVLVRLPKHRC